MAREPIDIMLIERTRARRSFRLLVDGQERYLEYRGDGAGFESVWLDGYELVRKKSAVKMVPEFTFEVESRAFRFEIEPGLLMSLLGPLSPVGLRRFAVYIDDRLVYEDRNGVEVAV